MGRRGYHVALAPGPRDQALWQVHPGAERSCQPGIVADQQGETLAPAKPGEGLGKVRPVRCIVVA